jgi:hypothetical protein
MSSYVHICKEVSNYNWCTLNTNINTVCLLGFVIKTTIYQLRMRLGKLLYQYIGRGIIEILKSLWKVSEKSLKSLWKVSEKSLKSIWKVSEKYLKSIWKVSENFPACMSPFFIHVKTDTTNDLAISINTNTFVGRGPIVI